MCDVKVSRSVGVQEDVLEAIMREPEATVRGDLAGINDVLGLGISNRLLHSALWHLVEQGHLHFRRCGGGDYDGLDLGYQTTTQRVYTAHA